MEIRVTLATNSSGSNLNFFSKEHPDRRKQRSNQQSGSKKTPDQHIGERQNQRNHNMVPLLDILVE
jgi:hypothetical protein